MPAVPKPEPRARVKARRKRQQALADRRVYQAVTDRDGGKCRVCGWGGMLMHRHHLVYRSQGGETSRRNVALVCMKCHDAIHAGRIHLSGDADGVLDIRRAA